MQDFLMDEIIEARLSIIRSSLDAGPTWPRIPDVMNEDQLLFCVLMTRFGSMLGVISVVTGLLRFESK